jgi:hypothetical protein
MNKQKVIEFYETATVRCIAVKERGGIPSWLCRNLGLTVRTIHFLDCLFKRNGGDYLIGKLIRPTAARSSKIYFRNSKIISSLLNT